jgi:LysR family transcriptional regulator for bpeEF and oprC
MAPLPGWNNRCNRDILLPAMMTIDINQLAVFVAVARAGSFTAAARTLGTQKAHVSRVISRLERQLGVQLLNRTTRSLAVTEVGRELYERATGILAALEETQAAIQHTQGEPQGVLKLTCGVEYGLLVVNGWIAEYLRRYPKVRVDADVSNRIADLIHEGFDLAIRIGDLPDSTGLAARRLGSVHYALYASPKYLKGRSRPAEPADLAAHDLIMFAPGPPVVWQLVNGQQSAEVGGPARLVVNNNMAARDAAVAGLGMALLPRFQAEPRVRQRELVEMLPGWTRPPAPIHAVFPSSRYLAPKVRAFIDLARASMPEA